MATPEKLPEGLKRIFAKKKFDPQNLLRKEGTNIQDINRLILQLNRFAEETSSSMKQSVYDNYSVFIEAAKDVAVLESDMHQLHHLLNEQKRLLQNLQERSIFGNTPGYGGDSESVSSPTSSDGRSRDSTANGTITNDEDKKNSRKNLASLLESTEGAMFIADIPGRRLEFESDLIELNPENFSSNNRIHAFLLNDSLVIAKHLPQRRGPLRYRFDQLYELTSLAVVDCKARRNPKSLGGQQKSHGGPQLRHPPMAHQTQSTAAGDVSSGHETLRGLAFTLMRFPDTRVLAAETAKLKRRWMDGLDRVKRRRAAEDSKKRESTLLLPSPTQERVENEGDTIASAIFSSTSSEDAGKASRASSDGAKGVSVSSTSGSTSNGGPAVSLWLEERFEDLDVAIAEHNFGDAVDLIDLLRKSVHDGSNSNLHEVRPRLDTRVSQLTDLLVHQLQPPENVGGVSGPTLRVRASVQSACRHLVRLGRWALACPLLLRYHSAWINAHLHSVRQEGSQLLYAKKLCAVFFHALLNTAKEYENLFENFPATFTAYCRWCQQEVAQFTTRLRPVLLDNRAVPFHVMCQAMQVARKHAEMYSSAEGTGGVGVDLVFFFEEALLDSWTAALREQSRVLQEAVEHRHGAGSGERWRPVRLQSEKERQALLAQMGVVGLSPQVSARLGPNGRLSLAEHTCQFARSLCQLAAGLGHLGCRELSPVGAGALAAVMNAEGRHYRRCLAAEQYFEKPCDVSEAQRPFILENLKFLLEDVLPIVEERAPAGMANLPVYQTAKTDWEKLFRQSQAVSV